MSSAGNNTKFDPLSFLSSAGLGRKLVAFKENETFFCQGDPADSIFYLQQGRAKLTVVSEKGKEATITILNTGDFAGEESLAAIAGFRGLLHEIPACPQHENTSRSC